MTIRVTRKAWKALTAKTKGKHDRNKCGVCSRPGIKKWSRAKKRTLTDGEERNR